MMLSAARTPAEAATTIDDNTEIASFRVTTKTGRRPRLLIDKSRQCQPDRTGAARHNSRIVQTLQATTD